MWRKLRKTLENPSKLKALAKKPELKYWVFGVIFISLAFFLLSDGEFSFYLSLASTLQMFSFVPLLFQCRANKEGLSLYTFAFYTMSYLARLSSILPYESYLPFDSTGDWFYQVVEILSMLQSAFIAYALRHKTESSRLLMMPATCLVAAALVHPTLNNNSFTDTMWAFSMYLEATALMPLRQELKRQTEVDSFSAHFIAAQGVSRILSFVFWAGSFQELNSEFSGLIYLLWSPGYLIFAGQLVSCILTADFLYFYMKSAVFNTPLSLPL